MKKKIATAVIAVLTILAFILYIRFLAPATGFSGKEKILYIYTARATREAVMETIKKDSILAHTGAFSWLASRIHYWDNIKPGRYKIQADMSVYQVAKLLRSGAQTPSRLVINKLRLPEDLARLMAKNIEADSAEIMSYLHSGKDVQQLGLNDTNVMAFIIPDTYEVLWTWTPERVLKKLKDDRERWWDKKDRKALAAKKGLTPEQVHILASIVEEETNHTEDKPKVASVYLNRMARGMPLQADPTIRYALKDFKMNRILYGHLRTPSAYNTYLNKGLPPGPICTPSPATLDAVLNAPETDYIFFVANADLMGGSTFTTNLADHNRAAKTYQDSLTAWMKRKAAREKEKKDSPTKTGAPQ